MWHKKVSLVIVIVIIFLILLMGGCNKDGELEVANSISETIKITEDTETTETTETTEITEITEITEETITSDETSVSKNVSTDKEKNLTALELTTLMGNGINLGNTMEAYGHTVSGDNTKATTYETRWGQPVTSKEMIQGMKDAGFDTLRIPVAWTNAMNFESGDYTIGSGYLDRVEQIVNYALEADMYVIINDHWDGGWWGMFGSATAETRQSAMDLYTSMWTQIGERFKDYSSNVIFESANEELGDRLNDITVAEDSGTLNKDACYQMTNSINQLFVDTIRQAGGNNPTRFLLIAGYNTDITATCDPRFIMPVDTVQNKLLLSVHYYTPWNYCGTDSITHWGTEDDLLAQNELLEMMTHYTELGYGIVFGEYSVATMKDGTIKPNTLDFFTNFLDNCDLYGYVPLLWDANSFYKKYQTSIEDEAIAALYKTRNLSTQIDKSEAEIIKLAQTSMDKALKNAQENAILNSSLVNPELTGDEESVAWLMFNSSDFLVSYSSGDIYTPSAKTDGLIAKDVEITGPGTYTIGLDFSGTPEGFANNTGFAAIGISNGEQLFPGYNITIKEIKVNDKPYILSGTPYTSSDDGICTRLNLYNAWVGSIPAEVRVTSGVDSTKVSATTLQGIGQATNIYITFEYGPVE